ncbi:acetolactate synthase large subunit [Halohasta litorea]|uniref:Acetolactate synthase large subunit n=1 Tax=Halohasta litorea TaxID=869891 RepID=A0ABD6D702_9EURY|nr:acetolactate synthase large subunit [Halohasta litorea]
MRQTGAELLVDCLEAEGVEYVFGIPGEELEDILFAIRESQIEFVPTRHEQGAAFMADVHGRLTGEAGVCLGTLGPGATNLLTGVADAHLDKAPLVALTGQGGLERLHQESHQALDVPDIFESVVKWNTQIDDDRIIAESVRKAFKLSTYEKPGATQIELPEDVMAAPADGEPLPVRDRVRRPSPDPDSLRRAAEAFAAADRPIVLAGNGAVRTDAVTQLRSFIERTTTPVVSTYMGKGAVSDRSEQSLFTLDSGPDDEAADAVAAADLVLAVGYDIAEHDPEKWNPDREKTILHLDHEPAEVYSHYNPTVELVSDIGAGIEGLGSALDEVGATVETDSLWCAEAHETILEDARSEPDAEPFTVAGTVSLLRSAMADSDILLSDVGSHKLTIARRFPSYEPNTCLISNGLASMGIALPGGIAADLAVDDNVVVANGDGGFLMNAAELETATRLGCSFTVVVFVDDDYGLISAKQADHRGEAFGTQLTNPDFVAFAESFGVDAYRPDDWDGLGQLLEAQLPSDTLSLIEVPLG